MVRRGYAVIACGVIAWLGAGVEGCANGSGDTGLGGDDASFDGVPPAPDGASDATGGGRDAAPGGDGASDAAKDGNPGDGAAGGDAAAEGGATGTALAAGGVASKSPGYRMYWTLGQGPGGNETTHSPHYQIRGGVVGATQKP